jgi:hypothetical protein
LPRITDLNEYHKYRVLKDIDEDSGKVATWLGQDGLGIQYKLENDII